MHFKKALLDNKNSEKLRQIKGMLKQIFGETRKSPLKMPKWCTTQMVV